MSNSNQMTNVSQVSVPLSDRLKDYVYRVRLYMERPSYTTVERQETYLKNIEDAYERLNLAEKAYVDERNSRGELLYED